MKNIIIIAVSFLFVQSAFSQSVIDQHFQFLKDQEASTHISVTGKMFEMINQIDIQSEDEEVNEMKEFVGSIRSFELINIDQVAGYKKDFKQGQSILDNSFDELVTIRDKEDIFKLYIDEENGTVYEIAGIGNHDSGMMVFSLLCEMRLDQVGKIVSKINESNLSGFKDLKDISLDEVKVYPNPVKSNSTINIELPEGLEDADVTIMDINGKQVKSYLSGVDGGSVDLSGIQAGNYIVLIEKGDVSIRRKVMVVQ